MGEAPHLSDYYVFYDALRRLIAYNIGTGHTGKCEVWIKKAILVIKTPGEQQWTNIMTGYRAFSYEFVKTFPVLSSGFEIETEMTIHAIDRKMQIETVVVEYRDRPKGSESKLNTIPDGIRVLRTISKLYRNYMPLRFFGIIAAFLAALSVLFFIPVWMDYLETGLVERFPTLIVCGITMVVALLMFVSGVILSTLRQKDRRDFEFNLVRVDWMKKRNDQEKSRR